MSSASLTWGKKNRVGNIACPGYGLYVSWSSLDKTQEQRQIGRCLGSHIVRKKAFFQEVAHFGFVPAQLCW